MNIKISVCIPCYNGEKYLDKIFKCLKYQTFKDFEVVIVNDGSTDDSLNILNEYKNSKYIDQDIIIINQENKGLAAVRNTLSENARGDYIFFLDVDDYIPENSLEDLYNNSDNGNKDIITGRTKVVFNNKFKFPFLVSYRYLKYMSSLHYVKSNICTPWSSLIKTEILKNEKFLEGYSYEDIGLMNYLYLKYTNFNLIKKVVYFYRKNKEGLSAFNKNNKWKIIDLYHQALYVFNKYKEEGWLNNKQYKRFINGTLFQMLVAVNWLSKHYSISNKLNLLPFLTQIKMLFEFNITLKYSKTFWKSLTFFYLSRKIKKCLCILKNNKKIISENDFYNDENKKIKNKIIMTDDFEFVDFNNKKYKKSILFSTNKDTSIHNLYFGVKPSSLSELNNLDEKIYFIDLRYIQNFYKKDIEFLEKINSRILILLNKNKKGLFKEISKINFIYI